MALSEGLAETAFSDTCARQALSCIALTGIPAGTAVDLTLAGTTVEWRMRTHPLSSVNVLQISGTSLASDGTFDAVITDVLTDTIEPRVYHHSAKVTDGAGIETVVALGSGDFFKTTT